MALGKSVCPCAGRGRACRSKKKVGRDISFRSVSGVLLVLLFVLIGNLRKRTPPALKWLSVSRLETGVLLRATHDSKMVVSFPLPSGGWFGHTEPGLVTLCQYVALLFLSK